MRYTMKKLLPSFFVSLIILGLSFFLYGISSNLIDLSESELSVSKHKMEITIEDNGAIYIKEDVTLDIDDYWNYLIKDIGFTKDLRVENELGFSIENSQSTFEEGSFIVEMYSPSGKKLNPRVTNNYDLDNNKYRSFEMTLHEQFVTGVRMHYEYRILNAVTVYQDIAELNWIFIDELDYRTKNIDIDVYLPINTDYDSVLFFGHGVSRDNALTRDGNHFHIRIDKLYADELIEARILFNKEAVGNVDSWKIVNHNAKEALLSIEDDIKEEQDGLRKSYNTMKWVTIALFILAVLVLIFNWIRIYKKYDKELVSEFDSDYYRELPALYSPAELGMLINFNELGKHELEATLLDLIRRKYIILDMNGCTTLDEKPNYKMILNQEMDKNLLKEHERNLLAWFFGNIAKGNELTLDQIDAYLSKETNANKYLNDSKAWGKSVLKESKKNDFFDDVKSAKNESALTIGVLVVTALVAFFGFAYSAFYEGIIFAGLLLSLIAIFIVYISQIKRRSYQGNEDYVRWMAFKNFLQDFSQFEDYPMPSIVIWEHYLVYATEFGIADKVEEQMRLKFKNMDLNEQDYISSSSSSYMRYHFSCYYFHRRIHATHYIARSTIQKAQEARSASRGSGSGGFGGGRSFGGGGGGMRGGR